MPKKVLIIDDDDMILNSGKRILEKMGGYEVETANSGMMGLLYIQNNMYALPDIILLDYEMPIMSGIRTLECIKDNANLRNIPVCFMTATADIDTIKDAISLGVADYIKKPFFAGTLTERVQKVLGE